MPTNMRKTHNLRRVVLTLETFREMMYGTKEQQNILRTAERAAEAILFQAMAVAANKNVLTKSTTKKKPNVTFNGSLPSKIKKGRFSVASR